MCEQHALHVKAFSNIGAVGQYINFESIRFFALSKCVGDLSIQSKIIHMRRGDHLLMVS